MDKILVTRSSMPPIEEYFDEVRSIWDSHWLTNMGEKHNQLESELTSYLKVDNISLFSNGHMALEMAIQAMKLNGEVITTPFTFASTTHAIVRNGLTPVFCDINPVDFTIDVEKLESLITDKTSAIVPVHVYGNVCQVDEINNIARKYGLKVLYDAAHAFGVELNGVGVGSFGDASMFSFHATKVFNTIEGGAIAYGDPQFGRALYRLKNFGIRNEEVVDEIGANAKMNEFQAAMGICNLRYIDKEIEKRKLVVECYQDNLKNVPGIYYVTTPENVKPNYAYFPIVVNEKEFGNTRNVIYDELKKYDIYSRKYFYPLTNSFECYHGKFDVEATPVAHSISLRVMTLPLYADLKISDVERICDIIKKLRTK